MKLAIMTKSTFFVEEDKILSSLFDEGMDNLHLFKPGSSPMYAERLLTLLPEDYLRKITVHDHYYLKQEYDLAGIHIDDPLAPVPDGYKGKFSRPSTDYYSSKSEFLGYLEIFQTHASQGVYLLVYESCLGCILKLLQIEGRLFIFKLNTVEDVFQKHIV